MKLTEAKRRLKPFRDMTRDYLSKPVLIEIGGFLHLCSTDGKAFLAVEVDSGQAEPIPKQWATCVEIISTIYPHTAVLRRSDIAAAEAEADDDFWFSLKMVHVCGTAMDARLLLRVLQAFDAEEVEASWPKKREAPRVFRGVGWSAVLMPCRLNTGTLADLPKVATPKGKRKRQTVKV